MSLLMLLRRKGSVVQSPAQTKLLTDSLHNWMDDVTINLAESGTLGLNVEAGDSNAANWNDTHGYSWFPTDGLLAEYRFDEGSGQVLTDYRGGQNGQLGSTSGADANDPTWFSGGLDWGSNDYVTIPAIQAQDGNFTVHIAFRHVAGASQTHRLLQMLDGSGTGRAWLQIVSSDVLDTFLGNTNLNHGTTLADNTWYVGTVRKNGTTVSVFLSAANVVSATRTDEANNGSFVLGINKDLSSLVFNGSIGTVLFYNKAQSDDEVLWTYRGIKTYLATRGVSVT